MSTENLSEVPLRLRRDVGLLPLFMVSAGSVIGSGWLLGTLNASKVAGPAAIISWIIGVILLIGIALIYAELGSTYPISGCTARFTWIHAGTLGGFSPGPFPTCRRWPSRRSRSRPRWGTSMPRSGTGW